MVLNSEWYLFVIIGDVAVLVALLYFHDRPFGHMLHMLLFALKLGLQWGNAYEATTQPVFGPNGVSVMLFLCIPLVQMPLQSSFLKPLEEGEGDAAIGVGEDDDPSRRLLSPTPSPTGGRDVYSERGSARHSHSTARNNEQYQPTSYTPISGTYTPSNNDNLYRKSNEGSSRPSTTTASRIQQQLQQAKEIPDTLSTFATNFNLYLSHLMHSLDIMSLYFFSFTSPETTEEHTAAPTPFRNFIAVLSICAFVVNNLVVLHLFFHRAGILNVVIPGLPKVIKSLAEKGSGITRTHNGASSLSNGNQGFLSDSRSGNPSAKKKPSAETAADAHKAAHRVKMLQYMIIMLIVVDIPFVIARLELWRKQYSALSIFVAKNIKDIVDMTMLLSRNSNEGDEGEGGAGDGPIRSGGDLTGDERKLRGISVVIPNASR